MNKIINISKTRMDHFGRLRTSTKTPEDFSYLLNSKVSDIILFDNGTQELLDKGFIILPRHYFIFVENKDGDIQYKPYEYNEYRIVVSTYKDIIVSIDSIG